VGRAAIDSVEVPLSDSSLALARESEAVFPGAVDGPKWESLPYETRPERALRGGPPPATSSKMRCRF
jgi:3-isopropylmalate dehydrogenase